MRVTGMVVAVGAGPAPRWSRLGGRWRRRSGSTSSWPAWGSRSRPSCCWPSSLACDRTNDVALTLARRWSQVMGVLVAVGAVTGTVLSFEMGLLWPGLMRQYGAVLGLPFGIEGLFFFLEAIFTAIYLYGWRRLPGWAHFWTGVPIAVSGIFGAMSVIAVNSWMNQPGGFTASGGRITSVNPWQVYFNHAALYEMPHMILAAYMVTGFLVAGVYAAGILRGQRDRYHYTGFALGFVPAAVLDPVPDLRRRHRGPRHRVGPAGEVRVHGVRGEHGAAGARMARRRLHQRAHLRRPADSVHGLAAGRVRPRHEGDRVGQRPSAAGRRWCG